MQFVIHKHPTIQVHYMDNLNFHNLSANAFQHLLTNKSENILFTQKAGYYNGK